MVYLEYSTKNIYKQLLSSQKTNSFSRYHVTSFVWVGVFGFFLRVLVCCFWKDFGGWFGVFLFGLLCFALVWFGLVSQSFVWIFYLTELSNRIVTEL